MDNYKDNLELDLKDLLRHIMTYWKIIAAFAVIGCILGSAFSMFCPQKQLVTANPIDELSKKDRQQVETAVETYLLFQKVHEIYSDKIAKELDSLDADSNMDQSKSESIYYEVSTLRTSAEGLTSNTLYSALNADQKAAFNQMIPQGISKMDFLEDADSDIPSDNTTSHNLNIKYPTIGLFAGIFLVCIIATLKYILSPTLKTEDDLRTAFKLPVVGTISAGNDDGLSVICSSITAIIKAGKAQTLSLVSSLPGTADDHIAKASAYLKEKGNNIESINSILSDPAAIDQVANSDGVILFESIGKSTYENIHRELELLNNLGINVVGAVVAKE